jgi:hypothetical protein
MPAVQEQTTHHQTLRYITNLRMLLPSAPQGPASAVKAEPAAGGDIPQEEADAVAALLDFNSEETPAGAAAAAGEAGAGPSEPKAEEGGEDAEPEYLVKWVNRWVPGRG